MRVGGSLLPPKKVGGPGVNSKGKPKPTAATIDVEFEKLEKIVADGFDDFESVKNFWEELGRRKDNIIIKGDAITFPKKKDIITEINNDLEILLHQNNEIPEGTGENTDAINEEVKTLLGINVKGKDSKETTSFLKQEPQKKLKEDPTTNGFFSSLFSLVTTTKNQKVPVKESKPVQTKIIGEQVDDTSWPSIKLSNNKETISAFFSKNETITGEGNKKPRRVYYVLADKNLDDEQNAGKKIVSHVSHVRRHTKQDDTKQDDTKQDDTQKIRDALNCNVEDDEDDEDDEDEDDEDQHSEDSKQTSKKEEYVKGVNSEQIKVCGVYLGLQKGYIETSQGTEFLFLKDVKMSKIVETEQNKQKKKNEIVIQALHYFEDLFGTKILKCRTGSRDSILSGENPIFYKDNDQTCINGVNEAFLPFLLAVKNDEQKLKKILDYKSNEYNKKIRQGPVFRHAVDDAFQGIIDLQNTANQPIDRQNTIDTFSNNITMNRLMMVVDVISKGKYMIYSLVIENFFKLYDNFGINNSIKEQFETDLLDCLVPNTEGLNIQSLIQYFTSVKIENFPECYFTEYSYLLHGNSEDSTVEVNQETLKSAKEHRHLTLGITAERHQKLLALGFKEVPEEGKYYFSLTAKKSETINENPIDKYRRSIEKLLCSQTLPTLIEKEKDYYSTKELLKSYDLTKSVAQQPREGVAEEEGLAKQISLSVPKQEHSIIEFCGFFWKGNFYKIYVLENEIAIRKYPGNNCVYFYETNLQYIVYRMGDKWIDKPTTKSFSWVENIEKLKINKLNSAITEAINHRSSRTSVAPVGTGAYPSTAPP